MLVVAASLSACAGAEQADRWMYAGEVDRARAVYERMYKRDNRSEAALFGLAFANGLSGDRPEALAYAEACAEAHPDSTKCLRALGFTRLLVGHDLGAREAYEKALTLAPDNGDVLSAVGSFEVEQGKFERARTLLQGAIEAAPDLGDFRFQLAELDVREGKVDEALVLLDEADERGYRDARLEASSWLLRGWAHLILGERSIHETDSPDIAASKAHFAAMEAALSRAESLATVHKDIITGQSETLRRRAGATRAAVGVKWDEAPAGPQ